MSSDCMPQEHRKMLIPLAERRKVAVDWMLTMFAVRSFRMIGLEQKMLGENTRNDEKYQCDACETG